jgi:hypothetical protein
MLKEDVQSEIEKLKAKRAALSAKISSTRNFDTKEKMKDALAQIDSQIKILEKMMGK